FPFTSPFDLPSRIWFSALTGTALCGFVLYAAFRCRDCFRKNDAGSRLFLAFVLFALGSAVLIAWGRAAWDEHGVANAMASRYTIFSSYLLYALVYLFVSNRGKSSILFEQISSIGVRSRLAAAAFLLFILLAENA